MSWLLVLGEGASSSEVTKAGWKLSSRTSLATVSAAALLSRTRTWSWCCRITEPIFQMDSSGH